MSNIMVAYLFADQFPSESFIFIIIIINHRLNDTVFIRYF